MKSRVPRLVVVHPRELYGLNLTDSGGPAAEDVVKLLNGARTRPVLRPARS